MILFCMFCGAPFTCYDNYVRKYCPKCQSSGRRYYEQFRERRKDDPVLQLYVTNYSKRHALYKKGKITKSVLDEWRHQVRIKRHELSTGEITAEDFRVWCDETYNAVRSAEEK